MNETSDIKPRDKWIFGAGILLLGAVLVSQLMEENPTVKTNPERVEPTKQVAPPITITPVENSLYSVKELHYFQEIAFSSEHLDLPHRIRRWAEDINVRIEGDPTEEDLLAIKKTLEEINGLQNAVKLSIGYFDSNLVIRFAPESTFKSWHGNYQPNNLGYFWVRWVDEEIYSANVLIDTSQTTQQDRNGLIIEEITQAMGLMNVSSRYGNSIFNDDAETYQAELSPLDKKLIEILYRPDITPSMPPEEALSILSRIVNAEDQ